jgi:hypothetical protein
MKTTTILKKLYELESKDYTGKKDSTLDFLKYKELIEQLKESINMESLPEGSTKKQYTAIKKMLKLIGKRRTLLGLTHIDEKGRQVFTDSYILFRFYNDAIIEALPKTTDPENEGHTYPQTEKLCDPTLNSSLKSPPVKISSLKDKIRTADLYVIVDLVPDGSYKAAFGKKVLDQFITIMNFKNTDTIELLYPSLGNGFSVRPLGVKYNNREGIILPYRMEA